MFKRRIMFIEPKIQTNLIIYSLVISLFSLTLLGISFFYFFSSFLDSPTWQHLTQNQQFVLFISHQEDMLVLFYLITVLVTIFLTSIVGLVVSHRVAGPIYRLRMHFKECAENAELKHVRFRKKDIVGDLDDLFNEMCDKINDNK